ncbi:preprotein translocase subunit SecY [Candidatus Falkowbacteria bacterium CG10_big_fil_rev_8_21_14_0_10_43_11]|uniref:Protein translocase subunit SecY n=1 Tax=Candidatus Falkowbacteria bacterium CG10_big_fil_rev_8_21_14_0_10_43_11 TaxID=1974568 RepID=A0A2M6WLX2_9BACT|nr:MAG: preprotein translocase subunit SecY [Candidatus Falkowbacteria bacterium CG10_big_fil_rev_8_21_14_0_10_43_11]
MLEKISQIWKAKDLRQSILFVLATLAVFRLAAHVPVPGVDVTALKQFFASNQMLGMINLFSGGGMENFSIVMMGVAPYITASIIFQLLAMIVPSLEEMQKEETGRQKINMWTRYLTVPMAMMQAYGMIAILRRSTLGIVSDVSSLTLISTIITITAGTVFLMWIGELISEKHIGNGISLLIFAGIVAGLPGAIQQMAVTFDASQLFVLIGFAAIAVITVIGVVIINEGQRNVPVVYAKQVRGGHMYGGTQTHLPLRVNMAGVMPIIFAISVILFPSMIAQFFIHARTEFIAQAAEWTMQAFNNQLIYGIAYFILVFSFTYFYTEVIFHPAQIAENLQKQGAFIPGIRPGKHTEDYIGKTTYKIILIGALFLALIAILPLILRYFTGMQSLAIGGTSILIVVAVIIETVKQIEAQLTMREYEGY